MSSMNKDDGNQVGERDTDGALRQRVGKNSKLDWPERLSVMAVIAAAISLLAFGGFLSALFLALAAVMGWTRAHREQAAQGKRSFSDPGRYITGAFMVVLAIALWPKPGGTPPQDKAASAAEEAPFSRSDALEPCEEAITPQLSHPSTADFDIGDTSFTEDEYGATFTIGLTAKNSFNLETKLRALCRFEGGKLVNAKVNEN